MALTSASAGHFDHNSTSHASSTLQSWLVILAAALFFFYEFIQMTMFDVINPELMASFHISGEQLGFLSSMYFYGNIIFVFPAGLLLDRFSTRKLLSLAMLVSIASNYVFASAHFFPLLLVTRFVTGLSGGFAMISCVRLASRWFPPRRVALVMGVVITMAMLGGICGQQSISWMLQYLNWRQTIVVDASFGVLLLIILFSLVRDYPPKLAAQHKRQQQQLQQMGFWASISLALRNPQNWLAGLYTNFLSLPVTLLAASWLNMYLMQARKIDATSAANVSMMIFLGTVIGSPIIGWLSDVIARRKLPLILGAVLSLLLVLIIMYVPHPSASTLMILFFLLAFAASAQVASYPLVIESNLLAITSAAEGITCSLIMFSGAIFQPMFGHLLDQNWGQKMSQGVRLYSPHAYMVAMWILPIVFAIAIFVAFALKETYAKNLSQQDS